MISLQINNFTSHQFSQELLEKIVKKILGEKNSTLILTFVGPRRIKKLNKTLFKKNRVTDLLVLPKMQVSWKPFSIEEIKQFDEGLGEIVICPKEIKKLARRHKSDFNIEFQKRIIKGTILVSEKKSLSEKDLEKQINFYLSDLTK
jgi:ssRNA-specific RNase YbeY (16S rRNA maturation enzyme)